MNKSTKIFLFLVILYAFLAALNLYLPQGSLASFIPTNYQYPAPKILVAVSDLIRVDFGANLHKFRNILTDALRLC